MRVEKGDGCWLYAGTPSQRYGVLWDQRRQNNIPAHVAVYEFAVGPVPKGHVVHHRCEVKRCVRPDHLEPVVNEEHNSLHHLKTACVNGHAYTPENTYRKSGAHGDQKICRTCANEAGRRYRQRQKELARLGS